MSATQVETPACASEELTLQGLVVVPGEPQQQQRKRVGRWDRRFRRGPWLTQRSASPCWQDPRRQGKPERQAHPMAGDNIIGGIGVSGAPGGQFDEECARAALAKIADRMREATCSAAGC